MQVRLLEAADVKAWIELRWKLWPDEPIAATEAEGRAALVAEPPLVVFVAEASGRLIGFLELSLRSFAEGCTSTPVPYVEGWYVEHGWRRSRCGSALMHAAEDWCRERGFTEMGSDTDAANWVSRAAHLALGFDEVQALIAFRKPLTDGR